MSARSWLNLALLVLVAGLAVLVALAPEERPAEPADEAPPLTRRDPAGVSRIHLTFDAGGEVEMLRDDDAWRVVHPFEMPANEARIATLTRVLVAPVRARIRAGPQELARFGLTPPAARLALDAQVILFGATEPLHGRRYVKHGDDVYLVDDAYFQHVSARPASYVALAPLAGHEDGVRAIELDGAAVRRDAAGWRLEPPDPRTSTQRLEAFVDGWRRAQATAVRPYRPERAWRESVEVHLETGSLRFEVARTEFEIILGRRDPGIEYRLIRRVGERLLAVPPPAAE